MKKLFASFILLNFLGLASFVTAQGVEDEFVKNSLDKNLKIIPANYEPLKDETAMFLNPSLRIKKTETPPEKDIFAEKTLNPNLKIKPAGYEMVTDNFASKAVISEAKPAKNKFEVSHETTGEKIKIKPLNYYTTRTNLKEGGYIDFELAENAKIGNKIYKKGSPVKARVENITKNSAYGLPADLVIGNFSFEDNVHLESELTLKGANRSLWVYPSAYGLSWFFGAGLLFIPIRGGHAKLKPNKTYEIEI